MISPNLMILKGRHRGLVFKELPPLYSQWLTESSVDDNTRAKLLDVRIQGRFISDYSTAELRALSKDDSITMFQLDAIESHLDKPVRWSVVIPPNL